MQILSGRITCAIRTSYEDMYPSGGGTSTSTYYDEQVLTWAWTNMPPLPVSGSPRTFSVQWQARGSGFKKVHQVTTSPTGRISTQDTDDTWTTNCVSLVQFQARQSMGATALSSQETYPFNGYTLIQTVFVDNIQQQGYPKTSMGPSIALAVSINWGSSSITDLLNTLDPISVAPPQRTSMIGFGLRVNRRGAPMVQGSRQERLTARGPDAPLGKYSTIANWSWEIATQP